MITQSEFNIERQQKEFFRDRLEAAEAKLSLLQRGYKLEDAPTVHEPVVKKPKEKKNDDAPSA